MLTEALYIWTHSTSTLILYLDTSHVYEVTRYLDVSHVYEVTGIKISSHSHQDIESLASIYRVTGIYQVTRIKISSAPESCTTTPRPSLSSLRKGYPSSALRRRRAPGKPLNLQ